MDHERENIDDGESDVLDDLFDASPIGQALVTPEGVVERANAALHELLHFGPGELVGRSLYEFTHPDDLAPTRDVVGQTLNAGPPHFVLDKRYYTKDGRTIWCRATSRLRIGSDGVPLGFLAQIVDISDTKLTELALEASERRYRRLVDDAPVGIYRTRRDGSFVDLNEQLAAIVGLRREEGLLTGTVPHYARPERRAELMAALQRNGSVRDFEIEFRARGGDLRTVLVSSQVNRDEGTFDGAAVDITERKRAELALAADRAVLQAVLDTTGDSIFCVDRDYRYTAFNATHSARLRAMYGTQVALGTTIAECVPNPDDYAIAKANLDRALAGERVQERHRWAGGAGIVYWVDVEHVPVRAADGAILGVAGFSRDVTAEVEAAAERARFEARLAQADRLASMGLLTAGVAHELNNPLTFVCDHIDSLARTLPTLAPVLADDAEGSRLAARLADSAREAAGGLRRIRDISQALGGFSRIDTGQPEPIDVTLPLEHAATMAHRELRFRAELVRELAPVPKVLASEGKLAQVFLNLLVNAAHAIPEGRPEENRVTLRSSADDASVFVEVADTGCGISPEHLARVFEPFFTTKDKGRGTGLGLAISRSIIAELGGELTVKSELGAGSRFVVRLPRAPDLGAANEQVRCDGAPAAVRRPELRRRVLVIDDEVGIRKMLHRTLARQHDVVVAESGVAAKSILASGERFDLVIADLMMPSMSGTELHEWVVEHVPALAKRFLFLTGGAFTPKTAAYQATSGVTCLRKPFESDELKRRIDELLSQSDLR